MQKRLAIIAALAALTLSRCKTGSRPAEPGRKQAAPAGAKIDAAAASVRPVPAARDGGSAGPASPARPGPLDIARLSVVPVEKDLAKASTSAREAVYLIEARNESVRFEASAYQKVVRLTSRKFRIVVQRPNLKQINTTRLPIPDPEGKLKPFLRPSPNLQSNAQLIQKLARKALLGTRSSKRAAQRLTRFVYDHITSKGYSLPAATALDVARLKQGDCTEHAYLLSAMGRAVGLPSRVASGLVFAEKFGNFQRVFVYHMWAEFLIGQQWIPFDATRPDEGVGATHILLATDSMTAMLPLMGSAALMRTLGLITIRVEDVDF